MQIEMKKSSDDNKEPQGPSSSSSFFMKETKSYIMEEVEEEVCLSASGTVRVNLNVEPKRRGPLFNIEEFKARPSPPDSSRYQWNSDQIDVLKSAVESFKFLPRQGSIFCPTNPAPTSTLYRFGRDKYAF